MTNVEVEITKVIDNSFPIFIECELIDCYGNKHIFHDKLPIFSKELEVREFPCIGEMRCTIIEENQDKVLISTLIPDDIESLDGENRFMVCKNQIIED